MLAGKNARKRQLIVIVQGGVGFETSIGFYAVAYRSTQPAFADNFQNGFSHQLTQTPSTVVLFHRVIRTPEYCHLERTQRRRLLLRARVGWLCCAPS